MRLRFAQRLLVIPTVVAHTVAGHHCAGAIGPATAVNEYGSCVEQRECFGHLFARGRKQPAHRNVNVAHTRGFHRASFGRAVTAAAVPQIQNGLDAEFPQGGPCGVYRLPATEDVIINLVKIGNAWDLKIGRAGAPYERRCQQAESYKFHRYSQNIARARSLADGPQLPVEC